MNAGPVDSQDAVDWRAPEGRGSSLFGAGATGGEVLLASGTGVIGAFVVVAVALAPSSGWNLLQYAVAAVIAFDLIGGVVANGLNSAKRDHFGPPSATARTVGGRLVRMPVVFTALHVHPIVVGVLYGPYLWWWGPAWCLFLVASVAVVRCSPLHLQRPVALASCALAALGSAFLPSPAFWSWMPVMLALKLVLAHAVQEEPYRPTCAATAGSR